VRSFKRKGWRRRIRSDELAEEWGRGSNQNGSTFLPLACSVTCLPVFSGGTEDTKEGIAVEGSFGEGEGEGLPKWTRF